MNWEFYFVGVSIITLYTYLIWCRIKLGVLPSISASAYELKKRYGKNRGYVFTGVMWVTAMSLLPVVLEHGYYFMFLPIAALCFVGAAPWYKERLTAEVHERSAMLSAVATVVGIAKSFDYCLVGMALLAATLLIYTGVIPTKNKTYKAELVLFLTTHAVVLITLIYLFK